MADICALDLSLTATGYAKSDGTSGVIEPKGLTGMPRLARILDRVVDLTVGADLVVIESFVFMAKGSSFADLVGLGTLVRFTLFEAERRYVDVNPGTLKKFATGSGAAKKPDMLEAAIRKLGWTGSNNDNVIDARWLLEMALAHYGAGGSNEKQRDALKAIAWPAINPAAAINPREMAGSA